VQQNKSAILLVNLGTPDRPDEEAIRRYLKQFLSDPRVVDLPRWLWLTILHLVILRTRPATLVEKYQLIWGTKDGPIRNISQALARRLQTLLPDKKVISAMTYGEPSIASAFDKLLDSQHVMVVPLFPQYAGATTGAVQDELDRVLLEREPTWQVDLLNNYHSDPGYIDSLASSIRQSMAFRQRSPKVIFSFHGLPKIQHDRGDPYSLQCQTTASLVAATLNLPSDRWLVTYQSRFGPFAWLKPYTASVMRDLPGQGVKDVLVVCPGFAVDCLETIEEIKVLNRRLFLAAGGETFQYVKALNASWAHAKLLADLITKRNSQGSSDYSDFNQSFPGGR